jgi:hypothetical protein
MAGREGTLVEAEEAQLPDQLSHTSLRRRVVTGIEEDATPAFGPGIPGEQHRLKVLATASCSAAT